MESSLPVAFLQSFGHLPSPQPPRPPLTLLPRLKALCLKYSSDMAPRINAQLYICVRPSLCQAVHPPVAPGDQMKLMATLMCLSRPLTPLDRMMRDQTLTHALDHMADYYKRHEMPSACLAFS